MTRYRVRIRGLNVQTFYDLLDAVMYFEEHACEDCYAAYERAVSKNQPVLPNFQTTPECCTIVAVKD